MNYLGHAYFSYGNPGILVGNLISDFVKGKKKYLFPADVQQGIELHRWIDQYTDDHASTRFAKEIYRPAYRLYCSAFIDVVYDHFLASDENIFGEEKLKEFSSNVYDVLDLNFEILPIEFQLMFPYMKKHDWLFNYRFKYGIQRSFGGLVRRAKYISESDTAFELFENNYTTLRSAYQSFISDAVKDVKKEYELLKID